MSTSTGTSSPLSPPTPAPPHLVHQIPDDDDASAPPNSPSSSNLSNSPAIDRIFGRSGTGPSPSLDTVVGNVGPPYAVDLRAITYVGTVDENLMCPICHCALIDPVTTDCDHTFCRECITDAISHSQTCPIDRFPMDTAAAFSKSPKIVVNQLDSLKARCPCCDATTPRSMLKHHLEKYCMEASVNCPGNESESSCQQLVKRKYAEKRCLHYYTSCPDCESVVFQLELDGHREKFCSQRQTTCELCGADILRFEESEHKKECPNMVVSCKWQEYGCQHKAKRGELPSHADECNFRFVGPMAEVMKNEISVLRADIRNLTEMNQLQERRIKFLEKGPHNNDRLLDYNDFPTQSIQNLSDSAAADPLDSAHEYLLSLLEAQESKVSQLSTDMTELDSKQTVMLLNETMPIKNELAEMRSTLQVTSMHVRWLLRFRIQENQRRPGPLSAPRPNEGGDGAGPSGDSLIPRRLSDSLREVITKL